MADIGPKEDRKNEPETLNSRIQENFGWLLYHI